ncbi:MAG: TRAP transporter substrate-binding protein [Alphaproteobacteria bacterium]
MSGRNLGTIGASVAAAAIAITASAAMAEERWDMPMAYADSNFHTQNGKMFAEAVTLATGGELEIIVHGGGSLFKGNEIKRAVQTGQAPIGERLLSAHQNENAIFGFDSVPFLATSFEDSAALWEAAKPTLEQTLLDQNLVLLYAVPWPPQGIYADRELNSAADMEGIKFRAYNSATARLAELAGAVAVQIEAAELSQALATGVAESFVSSGSTGYDRKVWEQLSHFYDVNAWLPRNYVMVNKDVWDALDEDTQNIVRGVAMMAEAAGTARSEQLAGWYLAQLADNGMVVQPAGPQLQADFEGIGEIMASEWLEAAGEDGASIVERYHAMD